MLMQTSRVLGNAFPISPDKIRTHASNMPDSVYSMARDTTGARRPKDLPRTSRLNRFSFDATIFARLARQLHVWDTADGACNGSHSSRVTHRRFQVETLSNMRQTNRRRGRPLGG